MLKRKRVVLLIPNLAGGGAERVVVNLLRHMNRQLIEPILMVVDLSGPYVSTLPPDIQVVNLRAGRVRYALPKIVREINRLQPDAVMSTLGYMNLAVLAVKPFLTSRPKLIVREANTPSKSIQSLPFFKKKSFTGLYRRLYPKADVIVTQSEGMRADLLAFLPDVLPEKVVRIYNPLDVDIVVREAEAFHPYPDDKLGKRIVAAGRLTHQKGFDLLLHAFQKVVHVFGDARLQILGEGSLKEELSRLATALGIGDRVVFEGFQHNPYPYIKHADLFVLSSRWEGFPNILLEALACGSKVVATECQSGPKEILGDNSYGLLVREECAEALAEGMIAVLNEGVSFRSGLDRARMFDAAAIVKEYESLFASNARDQGGCT